MPIAARRCWHTVGVTVSTKARDLLRDALETHENVVLVQIAAERERGVDRTKTLTHDAVAPQA